MPDYEQYRRYCSSLSEEGLRNESHRQMRAAGASVGGAAVAGGLAVFTFGLSLIGAVGAFRAGDVAATKADIVDEELRRRSARKEDIRARDLLGFSALT